MDPDMARLGSIIDDFSVSFRNHDLQAFAPYIAKDFQWFNADGTLVLEGAEVFLEALENFWLENPGVQNKTSECIEVGNLVAHTETFTGLASGHTDENIWVYEFQGEQIRKMFGYLVKK
jgi:hypothetical protein